MALLNKMSIYHYDQSVGMPGKKNSEVVHTTLTSQQLATDSDLSIAVTNFAQNYCDLSNDVYGGVKIETTLSLNETIAELEG